VGEWVRYVGEWVRYVGEWVRYLGYSLLFFLQPGVLVDCILDISSGMYI